MWTMASVLNLQIFGLSHSLQCLNKTPSIMNAEYSRFLSFMYSFETVMPLSFHILSQWSYFVLLRKSRLKLTKLRKFLCHMLFSMNHCNCICTDLTTISVYKFVFPLKHKVLGNLSIRKACYCLYTVCGSTIKPHD